MFKFLKKRSSEPSLPPAPPPSPVLPPSPPPVEAAPPPESPVDGRMQVGWITDVGQQRTSNEDAILVVQADHQGQSAMSPFGLFVLADGMGGHQWGEVASSLAVRVVARHVVEQIYLVALECQEHSSDQPSLKEVLEEAVNLASVAVSEAAPGGGTTVTCALLLNDHAYIASVGDSRAYLVARGQIDRVTRDHTLVDRLVELGQLTSAEAANHPQKNVLYRAVGQGGLLEVDVFSRTLGPGQALLLCSDGLWGMVEEAEMLQTIDEAPSAQAACQALVVAANRAGGRDNISAILIKAVAG